MPAYTVMLVTEEPRTPKNEEVGYQHDYTFVQVTTADIPSAIDAATAAYKTQWVATEKARLTASGNVLQHQIDLVGTSAQHIPAVKDSKVLAGSVALATI